MKKNILIDISYPSESTALSNDDHIIIISCYKKKKHLLHNKDEDTTKGISGIFYSCKVCLIIHHSLDQSDVLFAQPYNKYNQQRPHELVYTAFMV